MFEITHVQHANAVRLLEIIEHTPPHRINLDAYSTETACNTLHCSLGWAACHPHFNAQGLCLDLAGQPTLLSTDAVEDNKVAIANILFGRTERYWDTWEYLFAPYGDGKVDAEILQDQPGISDAELARQRIKIWLQHIQ